jgi:hypothetical protein
MSEISDILEEADELVTRYAGAVSSSWERNLEVLGTLMVVHKLWQAPEATVGDLLGEMGIFLRAAFRMGVESKDSMEV